MRNRKKDEKKPLSSRAHSKTTRIEHDQLTIFHVLISLFEGAFQNNKD